MAPGAHEVSCSVAIDDPRSTTSGSGKRVDQLLSSAGVTGYGAVWQATVRIDTGNGDGRTAGHASRIVPGTFLA